MDPGEASDASFSGGKDELWVLPDDQGLNLGFARKLSSLGPPEKTRIRLWVHNRHAAHLSLWERFLAQPGVSVVLFEAPGLFEAIEPLNHMAAHITLDAVSILESKEGGDILLSLAERFLFEKEWRSRIFPFTRILMQRVRGAQATAFNRFGLAPSAVEIRLSPSAEDASPAGKGILARLMGEAETLDEWRAGRACCASCDLFDACGGHFAKGDSSPCPPDAKKLVARIVAVGDEIGSALRARIPF